MLYDLLKLQAFVKRLGYFAVGFLLGFVVHTVSFSL